MKKKPIGFYDYTVVLTYCGTLSALIGIGIIMTDITVKFMLATIMLLVAGLCDMFDGTVAARKQRTPQEKNFGIQIDSLNDLIAFGVFPAIFVFERCNGSLFAAVIGIFYVLCALIRLAYFNVMEEERQSKTSENRRSFIGIPVTSIAIVLPAVYLIRSIFVNAKIITREGLVQAVILMTILALTAIGFVSPIEVKKPQTKGKLILLSIGAVIGIGIILFVLFGVIHK